MKKVKLPLAVMSMALALFGVAGCNNGGGSTTTSSETTSSSTSHAEFDFTVSFSGGSHVVKVGDGKDLIIDAVDDGATHSYSFASDDTSVATVSSTGRVTGVAVGEATISVTADTGLTRTLDVSVREHDAATGTFSYAGSSYATKGEIVGKLEKWALDNHISGLPLYEDGGLVMYSPRVNKGTTNYIPGYGFGILGEGTITEPLAKESNPDWKLYYHSAASNDPYQLNAWDNDGSEVSDLFDYISSGYWGTKMNSTKDGYDWYPVLAKDFPTAVNPAADGRASTWKFHVRTGDDGLTYRSASKKSQYSQFDGRGVELEDYVYTFKLLLTGGFNLYRGAELAGQTDSSGIYGAAAYFNATKGATDVDDAKFNELVGITADPTDNSLTISLLGPVNSFYAMYYLTSGLYEPIPRDFIQAIGGPKNFGRAIESTNDTPIDTVLSLSSYMAEYWEKGKQIVFGQNPTWFEYASTDPSISSRHAIKGVHITVNAAQKQDSNTFFNMFIDEQIDACGLPVAKVEEYKNDPRTTKSLGTTTYKLNMNACTQEQWEEKFGVNGTICQTPESEYWDVKPWMGNSDFLDGIFLSINRDEYATKRGLIPSANYYGTGYLIDPEEGISYNSTQAHKDAVSEYFPDTYGFNLEAAKACFHDAVETLVADGDLTLGTVANPTKISFQIMWMEQSQIADEGDDLVKYIEDAFNDDSVCGGKVVLDIEQDAVALWSDVYYKCMMVGQFDLAYGSISGNSLDPLNFMEVLRSDNSSGFTLNWGADTNVDDGTILFDGKTWSFNALQAAGDHGALVQDGVNVAPISDVAVSSFSMTRSAGTVVIDYVISDLLADNPDAELFLLGVTFYDGVSEIEVSEFGAEYTVTDTSLTIDFSAAAVAAFNAAICEDYGLDPAEFFAAELFGDAYEFVFYYSFVCFGIETQAYIELM